MLRNIVRFGSMTGVRRFHTAVPRMYRYPKVGVRFMSTNIPKKDPDPTPVHNLQQFLKDGSEKTQQMINKNQVIGDMRDLFKEMERRKYNMRWLGIGAVGLGTYLSYEFFKDWFTDQAADVTNDVTKKYLENEEFQKRITEFVEDRISDLAKSEKVKADVAYLLEGAVIDLANRESIQNELTNLFAHIFSTETINQSGANLASLVAHKVINGEEYESTRQMVTKYLAEEVDKILTDPNIQKQAGTASWNAFKTWFGGGPKVQKKVPTVALNISKY